MSIAGNAGILVGGKQEFVGISAVECETKIYLASSEFSTRNGLFPNLGAHAAFFANVREIG